jgi:hypothetical protein
VRFSYKLPLEFVIECDKGPLKMNANPEIFIIGINKAKIKIDIRNMFFFRKFQHGCPIRIVEYFKKKLKVAAGISAYGIIGPRHKIIAGI